MSIQEFPVLEITLDGGYTYRADPHDGYWRKGKRVDVPSRIDRTPEGFRYRGLRPGSHALEDYRVIDFGFPLHKVSSIKYGDLPEGADQ